VHRLRQAAPIAAGVLALLGATAAAQTPDPCPGLARGATATDVELEDLSASAAYKGRTVRTKGTLEIETDAGGAKRLVLREGPSRVAVAACARIARELEEFAGRRPRVLLSGVLAEMPGAPGTLRLVVWSYEEAAEAVRPRRAPEGEGLGPLLDAPDPPLGKTVRVTGQFGGRNLLKDLPDDSAPDDDAWVLRDGRQAIWVIGKRPEGRGFRLDPGYARDAGKWLAVEGKLERCGPRLCLRARSVSLSGPPS
jgi:hypothetical protein